MRHFELLPDANPTRLLLDTETTGKSPFYDAYPSAGELENTAVEELTEFLRKPSHNCGYTKNATEILDRIEEDAVNERDYQFGRDIIVRSIVRHIPYRCEELEEIETVLEQMLKEQDYQLQILTGVHTVTACALIAHIGLRIC